MLVDSVGQALGIQITTSREEMDKNSCSGLRKILRVLGGTLGVIWKVEGQKGDLWKAWVQVTVFWSLGIVDMSPELFGSHKLLDCGSWLISLPFSLGYLGPGFSESHETKELEAGHSAWTSFSLAKGLVKSQ